MYVDVVSKIEEGAFKLARKAGRAWLGMDGRGRPSPHGHRGHM